MKMQKQVLNNTNLGQSENTFQLPKAFALPTPLKESAPEHSKDSIMMGGVPRLPKMQALHGAHQSDIHLPISKSGKLEPVQIPNKHATDLIQGTRIQQSKQQSDQIQGSKNQNQIKPIGQIHRIYSVMQSTPIKPPAQSLQKLPPISASTGVRQSVSSNTKMPSKQANQSNGHKAPYQAKTFINKESLSPDYNQILPVQNQQQLQPMQLADSANGIQQPCGQPPSLFTVAQHPCENIDGPLSNLMPLDDYIMGRNSANSITFQGIGSNQNEHQVSACSQFQIVPTPTSHFTQINTQRSASRPFSLTLGHHQSANNNNSNLQTANQGKHQSLGRSRREDSDYHPQFFGLQKLCSSGADFSDSSFYGNGQNFTHHQREVDSGIFPQNTHQLSIIDSQFSFAQQHKPTQQIEKFPVTLPSFKQLQQGKLASYVGNRQRSLDLFKKMKTAFVKNNELDQNSSYSNTIGGDDEIMSIPDMFNHQYHNTLTPYQEPLDRNIDIVSQDSLINSNRVGYLTKSQNRQSYHHQSEFPRNQENINQNGDLQHFDYRQKTSNQSQTLPTQNAQAQPSQEQDRGATKQIIYKNQTSVGFYQNEGNFEKDRDGIRDQQIAGPRSERTQFYKSQTSTHNGNFDGVKQKQQNNQSTLPATSISGATTTNHYFINHVNFIDSGSKQQVLQNSGDQVKKILQIPHIHPIIVKNDLDRESVEQNSIHQENQHVVTMLDDQVEHQTRFDFDNHQHDHDRKGDKNNGVEMILLAEQNANRIPSFSCKHRQMSVVSDVDLNPEEQENHHYVGVCGHHQTSNLLKQPISPSQKAEVAFEDRVVKQNFLNGASQPESKGFQQPDCNCCSPLNEFGCEHVPDRRFSECRGHERVRLGHTSKLQNFTKTIQIQDDLEIHDDKADFQKRDRQVENRESRFEKQRRHESCGSLRNHDRVCRDMSRYESRFESYHDQQVHYRHGQHPVAVVSIDSEAQQRLSQHLPPSQVHHHHYYFINQSPEKIIDVKNIKSILSDEIQIDDLQDNQTKTIQGDYHRYQGPKLSHRASSVLSGNHQEHLKAGDRGQIRKNDKQQGRLVPQITKVCPCCTVSADSQKAWKEHQNRQKTLVNRMVSKMNFKHPMAYELLTYHGFFGPMFASLLPPGLHLSLGSSSLHQRQNLGGLQFQQKETSGYQADQNSRQHCSTPQPKQKPPSSLYSVSIAKQEELEEGEMTRRGKVSKDQSCTKQESKDSEGKNEAGKSKKTLEKQCAGRNNNQSGSSRKLIADAMDQFEVQEAPTPLLFKVEKVLGVHACPYSNRVFMKEFMDKYDFKPFQGAPQLLMKDEQAKSNLSSQVSNIQKGQASKLTSIDRYLKVRRYLEKRQKRMWNKKISYTVRKDCADKRLRVKGRFVRLQDIQDQGEEPSQFSQIQASVIESEEPVIFHMQKPKEQKKPKLTIFSAPQDRSAPKVQEKAESPKKKASAKKQNLQTLKKEDEEIKKELTVQIGVKQQKQEAKKSDKVKKSLILPLKRGRGRPRKVTLSSDADFKKKDNLIEPQKRKKISETEAQLVTSPIKTKSEIPAITDHQTKQSTAKQDSSMLKDTDRVAGKKRSSKKAAADMLLPPEEPL